ncbi:hypothetical protein VNO80_13510 [Phaseolus coccineus]|uniref:Uncharacterized protein n=1 Tax=Phaseolus coccineus TaxID=3886 RepID=A0AAN9N6C0_PHACN
MPRTFRLMPRTSRLMFCFDIMVDVKLSACWFMLRTSILMLRTFRLMSRTSRLMSRTFRCLAFAYLFMQVFKCVNSCRPRASRLMLGLSSWLMQIFKCVGSRWSRASQLMLDLFILVDASLQVCRFTLL